MTPGPPLRVVAGILRDAAGRVLLAQRLPGSNHAGRWEFPGGKVEPGENPQEALARELREELGIEARIGRELFRARHRYRESQADLEVIFFQVNVDPAARLQNLVFEGFEWADPSELPQYDFLEADREFVALLALRAIPLDSAM